MGAIGGGIWHGIKGARNSPRVCPPPPIFLEAAMRRFFFPDHNRRFIPTDHFDRFSPINDFSLIHFSTFLFTHVPEKQKHRASVWSDPSLLSKLVPPFLVVTLVFGVVFSQLLIVRSRGIGKKRIRGMPSSLVS